MKFISFDHDNGITYIGSLQTDRSSDVFRIENYVVLPRRVLEDRMMKKDEEGFQPSYFEICKKYWGEHMIEENRGRNIEVKKDKGLLHFLRDLDEEQYKKEISTK